MAKVKRPSKAMKSRFRMAKKANPKLTMKAYARKLAEGGDEIAKAWLFNKSLKVNKEAKAQRWDNKGATIMLKRAATKLAKRRRAIKRQGKDSAKSSVETPKVTSE